MTSVKFYDNLPVSEDQLRYAVIDARLDGQWILCRHVKRDTWEIPGGKRITGESIVEAAKRELWEETGIEKATLHQVCVYSVEKDHVTSYGMLYFAEVLDIGMLPHLSEMQEISYFPALPDQLTYPDIQPFLHEYVLSWLKNSA